MNRELTSTERARVQEFAAEKAGDFWCPDCGTTDWELEHPRAAPIVGSEAEFVHVAIQCPNPKPDSHQFHF